MMRWLMAMVSVVERQNEPNELNNSHITVNFELTPFLTPVLALQESGFIKTCSRINYRGFSVDYLPLFSLI
jgi:hypothetical protein